MITRGETWPLLELCVDALLVARASCMSKWSSTLASAMYWPQPRRLHFIHRSFGSDRSFTSDVARPLKLSGECFLATKRESSVWRSSICRAIAYVSRLSRPHHGHDTLSAMSVGEREQRAVRQARRWHAVIDGRCLSCAVVPYRRCQSLSEYECDVIEAFCATRSAVE